MIDVMLMQALMKALPFAHTRPVIPDQPHCLKLELPRKRN
jgi:hypothetical protein